MSRRTASFLIATACILHGWYAWQWSTSPLNAPRAFVTLPRPALSSNSEPRFLQEFISPPLEQGITHVASLCELPDGSLAAAWYSGSKEAAPDVVVHFSVRNPQEPAAWSPPRVIADPASASREMSRLVRKVGNPLIFTDSADRLWLVYVTMPFGGWSGSSLNVKISRDRGATWTNSQRLALSPFFNISELVRNNPIPLQNGGFCLPIYHECMTDFPEMLRIREDPSSGKILWKKEKMTGTRGLIQPSVTVHDATHATAFFRSTSGPNLVAASNTDDAGSTWTEPVFLDLPNPNSALSTVPLPGGKILVAFNDGPRNRENLSLAVSQDRGAHWTRIASLEDAPGQEFSYPYMIRDRMGDTHLAYTWCRKRIRHAAFNDAWIEARMLKSQGSAPLNQDRSSLHTQQRFIQGY